MLSLAELSRAVDAYRGGNASLNQFEDWFHLASRNMFGESPEVLEACMAIDMALSELRDGGMSRADLGKELAAAITPFPKSAICANARTISIGTRVFYALSANEPVPELLVA